MRELKAKDDTPILNTHYPFRKAYRSKKRWIIASGRKYDDLTMHNTVTEAAYHRIIKLVKAHLTEDEVYFERDYKEDSSEGIFGMHAFFTKHFYWRLDCALTNDYVITFAFNRNCPYANVVKSQLRAYPLYRAVEYSPKPDFDSSFANTLRVQDKRYQFILKGNHS